MILYEVTDVDKFADANNPIKASFVDVDNFKKEICQCK